MSRPRLDAEQKKVSFSLAFSPNLIAALEKVRGAKSQSVFVEEWLRQHPQIAAELAAMNDPGFLPPVMRYEHLMELLLAFYSPGDDKQTTLAWTLFIAHKVITRTHESSEGRSGTDQCCDGSVLATSASQTWELRGTRRESRSYQTSHQGICSLLPPDHLSGNGKGGSQTPATPVPQPRAWV